MSTVVDWNSKPEPWRHIGLAFAAECAAIAGGVSLPPFVSAPLSPTRRDDLRRRRLALGLSQVALGQHAGLWQSDVGHAERKGVAWSAKRVEAALDRLEAERAQS